MRVRAILVTSIAWSLTGVAAEARSVKLENKTGGVLRGVYATEVGDDNWRLDRLTDNVQADADVTIVLPGAACRYDIRVLLEQRPDEVLFMNVDICRSSTIEVDVSRGRQVTRDVP